MMSLFTDRAEAGRHLASKLRRFNGADAVVYALPRGGVSVGAEIAESLGVPLDVTFAGKICAPWETSGSTTRAATARGGASRPILPAGHIAIVVDDGFTSGVKLQTVVKALRWHGAKAVVVAQPVAALATIKEFAGLVDEVICIEFADSAENIGRAYVNLPRIMDGEVEDVVYRLTSH